MLNDLLCCSWVLGNQILKFRKVKTLKIKKKILKAPNEILLENYVFMNSQEKFQPLKFRLLIVHIITNSIQMDIFYVLVHPVDRNQNKTNFFSQYSISSKDFKYITRPPFSI